LLVAGITLLAVAGTVLAVSTHSEENRIKQFHYEFTMPDGWEQIGSNTQFRETDLRPTGATGTAAKIIVQEDELDYDATADRNRAVSQLRGQYNKMRAQNNPPAFNGFNDHAIFADRAVISYNERGTQGTLDWYVVLQGKYEVSVGCQHGGSEAERVKAACDRVVRSLTIH